MKGWIYNWIFWAPRVLTIIFILFLLLMSLDVYSLGMTFWEVILGLFMHNIPMILLTIILIISWKHELVGAISFTLFAVSYMILYSSRMYIIIAIPAFAIGVLFFADWYVKRK